MEDEAIVTLETEWIGLIDAGNDLIGIIGMKVGSIEVCYYKIENGMAICEQPTYQTKRSIRLIAKNGKYMIVDPKPSEITLMIVGWPIEGH